MIKILRSYWEKYNTQIAFLVSIAGILLYLYKSWVAANFLTSSVYDESAYVARGFLVASGRYEMYADYGPFFDHMPLSFIIPGIFQVLFSPGIRTARYLSFAIGGLALIGLWFAAKKAGGRWWAAAVPWVFVFNPRWIESYSLAYSQSIVTFFTSWALVFLIGKQRKIWQIILASILAGLSGMTRLNMMPVLLFFILYSFWQHGKKAGIVSAVSGIITVLTINFLFWPGILKMWVLYLPGFLFPSLLDPYRVPFEYVYLPDKVILFGPNNHMGFILTALQGAVKGNLLVLMGILVTAFTWPRKSAWVSGYKYKLSTTLFALYLFLFAIHAWASLGGTSCNFTCFDPYLQFFSNIGILVIILTSRFWPSINKWWKILLLTILSSPIARAFLNSQFIKELLKMKIQRGSGSNYIFLWQIFTNKTGISLNPAEITARTINFIIWIILLILVWIIVPLIILLTNKISRTKFNYGSLLLALLLAFGLFVAPSQAVSGNYLSTHCEDNILDSHESVGQELKTIIPPGALVYYFADSWMTFLEISEVEIFPPLTMYGYTFLYPDVDADLDLMLKFGFWNDELKETWFQQADYILVEGRLIDRLLDRINSGEFEIKLETGPVETCRGKNSVIYVVVKNQDEQ